uniref:MULE transposase domain-containing protein n=1 Tax=Lactuca sativa TaxID=4236 RepID=A0A9R1XNF4_LACSA|nr:hypothetical protein LSAT_V11C200099080 [Lactuca sativa]
MLMKKSTKDRFKVVCYMDKCDWRIRAKKHNTTDSFQVVKLSEKHTFSNTQLHPHHRQANKKVLGHFLKGILVYSTDNTGILKESFLRLPIYCYNLEKKNLGAVSHIKTSDENKFEYFFMAIVCTVRAFQRCLHPIIIINGAHLKGKYFCTMFLTVGMDGNNQILPIAFGVGKIESGELWIWFLSRLKECIGDMPYSHIISDRANSIEIPIQTLLSPFVDEYENKDWQAIENIDFVLGGYKSILREILSGLHRALNDDFQTWLDTIDNERWTRSCFLVVRYNIMTSNSVESINALSRDVKKLSISMLIDFFRATMQQWWCQRCNVGVESKKDVT